MSEKYEREIDELLRRLERRLDQPPHVRIARRLGHFFSWLQRTYRSYRMRPKVEQLMMASILLFLLSYLFSFIYRPLASFATLLSVALFIMAIATSLSRGPGRFGSVEKRWRGQIIDYRPRSPSLWWRIRRWWNRLWR